MAESAISAHPSISTLRLTSANEVLYDGPATEVDTGRDCRLRVVARWLPSQELRWTADFAEPGPRSWSAASEIRFRLKARSVYSGQEVVGWVSIPGADSASGWMDGGAVVGRVEAAVPAVLVRWVNLGDVGGGGWLEAVTGNGTQHRWTGHQSWPLGEWTMAVEARPDLSAVVRTLKDTGKYAVTHLAVLHRADMRPFTAVECKPLLTAYQLASSFVLGRFTSPALAEGRDDRGRLVWREWGARMADPLGGVIAWWNSTAAPMPDPVGLLGAMFLDPKRGQVAKHLAQAYVASNRGGLSSSGSPPPLLPWNFYPGSAPFSRAVLTLISMKRRVLTSDSARF
jgi:hypothetical protein